ncbi:Na+(or H+)/acetate symporter ActP [Natronorubrum sediminis]|uniref:Na+(Or H+)/acetate symporter ActP n=1 Tax=Natronorubrum sediminis TaxID=640943 RepID=A0A1H6G4S8_9EURY|nr:sodium:solute symporter family protein [Natronorubrum sediminis]SEH18081.1 Na+(or H+)/acetate symporter ActP [Natronorubrum sediminis]
MLNPLQVTPEVSSGPEAVTMLVLYFILVTAIGVYFFRKSRESTGDFWIAGGNIPLYVQVFAYFAVTASAGSFFGFGGFAYDFGAAFSSMVVIAVCAGGLMMMVTIAAPMRRSGVYTVPDYMKKRYQSTSVRLLAGILFAVASWAYLVPQLTAAGITMEFVLPDLGYELGLFVSVVIFALYVSLGGMWAVTWTDFIQGIMMFILTLLPLPIIFADMGVGGTLSGAMANDPAFASNSAPYLMILGVGFSWIFAYLGLPQFGQRVLSSSDAKTARRGFMWMNLLYISAFVLSAFFVAGAAMALEPDLATADHFYYAVLEEYTGPIVQGIGAAGLLAAVMSSTDALLVALSASVSHDIPESLDMGLTEKQETRFGTVVIWVGALAAAYVAISPPGIIGVMTTIIAGFAASGLFPALAIGTWWKRANAPGAIAAMLVGGISYVVLFLGGFMPVEQSEVLVTVPLGVITFIVVTLATRRPTGEELQGFIQFHRTDDTPTTVVSDD